MRLNYFKDKNFGDALNPIIFNKLLPGFFDDDDSVDFFGIGTLIGDTMDGYRRKVIFSTGSGYRTLPHLDESYEILCVRGPQTAKALNLPASKAVTDGASLLHRMNLPTHPKVYDCSFMPHVSSEDYFDWKSICEEAGVHYVSPRSEPAFVLEEILKSRSVVAEAMHFAIVADTLRVPFTAMKAYPGINRFKWLDWTQSLSLDYNPVPLPALFDVAPLAEKIRGKSGKRLPNFLCKGASYLYSGYQSARLRKEAVRKMKEAAAYAPRQLSRDTTLNSKVDQLSEILYAFSEKYLEKQPAG